MLERVFESIIRYSMFEKGQRVGVAVSGGADSVCLLHVLLELAPRCDLRLSVLHLNHELRGDESRLDASFVQDLATRLGLETHFAATDVGRICRETGENLEQAARHARRDFFLPFLKGGLLDRIALGHTRSDQAETVLFRFLRGSGTAGLAGIRPVTAEGLVRPLLDIERAEVEQYLRDRGISWREDATNHSAQFARNRIRRDLLPALTREWNPSLCDTLARTANWALEEETYWEAELDSLSRAYLRMNPPAVFLSAPSLISLPRAVGRRLIRRAVECAKGDLRGINFEHIDRILVMAGTAEGHGRLQIPGTDVFRSFEWLRFAPPGTDRLENRNFRFVLEIPGQLTAPDRLSTISMEVVEKPDPVQTPDCGYNEVVSWLDWNRLSGSLELRNWRPGDQYRPVGRSREEKIKFLFQEARVPLWERRHWPIITDGEAIIWARRFGPAFNYAADAASQAILKISEIASPVESWNL